MLHLGIVAASPMVTPQLIECVRAALPEGMFTDGDSNLIWGEGIQDNTLHVLSLVGVPDVTRDMAEDERERLMAAVANINCRVMDYTVVTDDDTWSENQEVITPIEGHIVKF